MNKKDLTDQLSEAAGISANKAQAIINHVFDAMADGLVTEGKVVISDFGTFTLSTRKAFTGKNPRTGEAIEIPARKVPVFRAGKGLRGALNDTGV